MASTELQDHEESFKPSADVVGRAFVQQYYLILHNSPELVYRFYNENSIVGRPDESGTMTFVSSMLGINEKITSFHCGNAIADVATVDSQDSFNGGVFVVVTGYLNGADNSRLKFTQSFFLAPQDTGYYVFNDVFRYLDDGGDQYGDQTLADGAEGPHHGDQDSSSLKESHVSELEVAISSDVGAKEVSNPGKEEVSFEEAEEEEKALVPEVFAEIPVGSKPVESIPKIEEAPKRSYASILSSHHGKSVKVISPPPLPVPSPAPAKITQQNPEPLLAAPTPIPTPIPTPTPTPIPTPTPTPTSTPISVPVPETVTSAPDSKEILNNKEVEDGYSIYIRGLPWDSTAALVETKFKKFGPIKANGIQVKFQKGFCFGFVEFEVASGAQSALEASPIYINGHQVFVEEKRSTLRGGGGRGRLSGPRVNNGYRSEGVRGRGFGGGRGGYGRSGEYLGGRNGNRGGYQRVGGSRAGLLGPVDASLKNTPPQVHATA